MPVFTLWRSFDPEWTDEDFAQMMRRAIAGGAWPTHICWHRSFGIDKESPVEGFCVYEAESLREIETQQRVCRVPFTEVREVEEARGPGVGLGPDAAADGHALYLAQRTFPTGFTFDDLVRTNAELASADVVWLRSYWDAENRSSRCIFAAASPGTVSRALASGFASAVDIQPVLSDHPSAWVAMYDQMGLPHHWDEPVTSVSPVLSAT